jgi:hypothetical protein
MAIWRSVVDAADGSQTSGGAPASVRHYITVGN